MPDNTSDKNRIKQFNTEYREIISAGFLPQEAADFVCATTPDGEYQDFKAIYNSDIFQQVLESRMRWVRRLRERGVPPDLIPQAVAHYYELEGQRTVFDFVKAEYEKSKYAPTDYEFAMKVRSRTRILRMSGEFGIRYHKPMKKEWRPKEPAP